MKSKLEKLKHLFFVTRPYSFIDIILVAILANVVATSDFIPDTKMAVDALVALLCWSSLLLLGERRKNKEIGHWEVFALLIPLSIIIAVQNPLSLVFLIICIFFLFAYTQKAKSKFFGLISPINRGMLTVLLFFIVLSTHDVEVLQKLSVYMPVVLVVFLSVVSRNIIGDIRDWSADLHTLPRRHGKLIAFILSSLLILGIFVLVGNVYVVFPLIVLLLLMSIYKNRIDVIHRLYILTSTFFLMNYIQFISGFPVIFSNILFLAVILNETYDSTPRTLKLKKGLGAIGDLSED